MSAPFASQRLPPERSAPPRDLEIRPKQVKAWLDALPLAKSSEAARMMAGHLGALNRAKFDLDARLQILETYRPLADTVMDELDALYSRAQLPLGQRAREALTLARALAFELASGYRIAIAEKTGKLIAFGAKKQLPSLVMRAMEYLAAEMRASYRAYSPVPVAVWHDLHQLYVYAEKEGIAAEVADAETKATPADAYGECLLLSLTDPYRLVHGEAEKILAHIRGMRGLVTLGQARPATRPGGHFLVPCDTDKPPKPALSANDDTGGPNWRLLDTNPLVDKLRARKLAFDSGNVSATTSKAMNAEGLAMLAKLITLWGDPPRRASRRDPMETTVAVCAGIRSLSHFVAAEANVDPAAEAAVIKAGITIPLVVVPDDETAKQFPVHEWDVVNQSEGGVKLRRTEPALAPIAIGEVVGIKFMGRARWTLGAVRWITQLDEGGLEFGVQFIAPAARLVWVHPAASASPQAKQGLVLDNEGAEEAALLTGPNMYLEAREYELNEEGSTWSVRATRLVEKTSRFELFHVEPM